MSKPVIRHGSPFTPSGIESIILSGMKSRSSLHREEVKFYAGDAAFCSRRAVKFLITDRIEETSPSSLMYMRMGSAIHGVITDALHKSGNLIFKEFRLPPSKDPDMRGLIDAIIFGPSNSIVGLEIKSCGNIPAKPKDDHLAQALLYSAVSGLDMHVVYVSRKVAGFDGKLMLKSFEVETTTRAMTNALAKVCLALYGYEMDKLPPIPMGFSKDEQCGFCPFTNECWEGAEEAWPTLEGAVLNEVYDRAEKRATEILEDRENRRNGILKHIQRNVGEDIAKRMEEIDWR